MDAAEARTDQLYRLKKKYGATVEDMIAYLEQCRSELDAMETADDTLILLNGKLKKAEAVVRAAGAELTQKRKAAAQALEQRIQSELRDLDMNKVRFAIEFTEKEPAADGCDVIRFLMSANAGEDLRPIAKIASGGELARIMLALKNVLAEQESIATLVFDEVDTGVSGRAAQKVAEKLTQVAQHKQVLCVTHLPQLAAMADTHFSVEKGESGGRTFTRVIQLDREARKAELARITGGSQVTPALLESAANCWIRRTPIESSILCKPVFVLPPCCKASQGICVLLLSPPRGVCGLKCMGAERMKQMTDATILFNLVFEQEMETQVNEHRTEQEILFLCHSVHPRIRIVGGLHHCRWVLYRAKPR